LILPKEVIWQEFRASALGAIPAESVAGPGAGNSLDHWYRRGYFTVRSANRHRFELRSAPADIGGALLADVEHFLDCAAEHQVSLWRHVNTAHWLSPAWMSVTFYYWAFFLGLTITRLLGRTVWFLDKETVRALLAAAPAPAKSPGSGCFVFSCGAVTSLSERDLTLTKAGGRVHDELWSQWSGICESTFKRFAKGSSTSQEERLFAVLNRSYQILGTSWPSAFRNRVNYLPGFAYSAVRRDRVLTSLRYLRDPLTYDCALLIDKLEASVTRVGRPSAMVDQPQAVAELLVHHTFALHALTDALYWEVIGRHRLDRRWADGRIRFLKSNDIYTAKEPWPC